MNPGFEACWMAWDWGRFGLPGEIDMERFGHTDADRFFHYGKVDRAVVRIFLQFFATGFSVAQT
jgi:hypothetical protein